MPGFRDKMFASQVVRQVSLALSFLHHNQWVHRDIKPANLAVDHLGVVKVRVFMLCW